MEGANKDMVLTNSRVESLGNLEKQADDYAL